MNWCVIIALIYCIPVGTYFIIYFTVWRFLKVRGWQAVATLNPYTLRLSNPRWIMPDGREISDRSVWKVWAIERARK